MESSTEAETNNDDSNEDEAINPKLDLDNIQKELIDVYFCDIHWEYISEYVELPKDFIKQYFEKLNINKLLQNKSLSQDTKNFINTYTLIL